MKGYKAFEKGLICRGKQYAENTVFEEKTAEICSCGMHFCKEPLDVLDYYPLVDSNGDISDFAEVEALDECKTDDDKKFCTKKLKIGAKIDFPKLVQASVNFEHEKIPLNVSRSSGNFAQIGSSGNFAKIGSSGNDAQIGSSGDSVRIGSSGNDAQIGSSGNDAQIGSSGSYARIASNGANGVVSAIGISSRVKGVIGTWITLAEYEMGSDGMYMPICVKSAQIDGDTLKADTWYVLKNGEFTEVE